MIYGPQAMRLGRCGINRMIYSLKNKRILVTGYEGFLGSNLTLELLNRKAAVFGLDILTGRKDSLLWRQPRKINVITGSVCDFKLLKSIIARNRIDAVIHLAATSLVGEAYKSPIKAFSTNIEGTWNILEAVRLSNKPIKVIVASSDKAYGIHNKLPYREDSRLSGSHPYDVSKSCADLIAFTYYKTYGLDVCVTRCGNIFGPGDFNFSRLVPDAVCSAVNNKTLTIRSNGLLTRDYIYVKDVVNGYLLLLEKMYRTGISGESFNFSDENPLSVIKLVKIIARLTAIKPKFKIANTAKNEIPHQFLASAKARKVLAWKPEYSLEDGLRITIDWYANNFRGRL